MPVEGVCKPAQQYDYQSSNCSEIGEVRGGHGRGRYWPAEAHAEEDWAESELRHQLRLAVDPLSDPAASARSQNDDQLPIAEAARTSDATLREPTWPPPYLSAARLAARKGWHLLNEYVYGAWAVVAAARETVHILGWAHGAPKDYSIDSRLPASTEGAMASGALAVIEAIGTAHLISHQCKKKSEIERALLEHADGHARFTAGNTAISSLLAKRHALLTLLNTWPRQQDGTPIRVWQRSRDATLLHWESTARHLKTVDSKLQSDALDLVDDFEHYVVYEQAANQLAESNDNVRALGIAVARDCVVQLGGTGCNAADAATKLGAHGVDLVANGIASGAFSIAMGALHVGAGMLGWYQAERRLEDLEAVRQRGANLRSPQGREAHVQSAIAGHQQWLIAEAARTKLAGVRHLHMANAAAVGSPRTADDVEAAKELVDVLTVHQAQAFKAIEATELKRSSRAKFRITYGTVSMVMGAGAVIAATVASGGIFALALSAVAFGVGFFWLGSALLRFLMDRIEANLVARRDGQQKVEAERILKEHRRPTILEMRRNRFVAIDAMLLALFDGDRPISGRALADALTSLGMDRNLVEALKLRSTVRLDGVYAADRDEILEKLRCFASKTQKEALKAAIGGMALRSDEALLKSLRHLFQEFIEGKTAMRQEYERRTGVFSFLGQRIRAWLPRKAGSVEIASAQSAAARAQPAGGQLGGCAPV